MAMLVTMRGPDLGKHFPLQGDRVSLGRQVDCAICLASKQVSRQHPLLIAVDGGYQVEDLGSSNGTYLNGQRLSPHRPTPLTDRDLLQIGPYVFGLRQAP